MLHRFVASLLFAVAVPAFGADVVVYKSPTCGCCEGWTEHMRAAGFHVVTRNVADMAPIKDARGVPAELASCHTATVDGYVIEGHVPASDIKRLLAERPKIRGLAAPGMPAGSPGMEGPYKDHYDVLTFDKNGQTTVFAHH